MPDPQCPVCRGCGLVAPCAMVDEREAWPDYLDRIIGVHLAEGWDLDWSPNHCKMIRPIPCPQCSAPAEAAPEPEPFTLTTKEVIRA